MLALTTSLLAFSGPITTRVTPRAGAISMDEALSTQYKNQLTAGGGGMAAYMLVREGMTKGFNQADVDGDGFISEEELGTLLSSIGETMSEEEVASQFKEANVLNKDKITYEQWCKAFLDSCKASQQGSSGGGGGFKFPWDK